MSKVFKAIGNAVSGVVKAVVNVVSAVVKAVVNVVASVVSFIAQPFMGLLGGMPNMPDAASMAREQQGVLIPREGSDEQIPIVYGYRKLAGVTTFAETGSSNNKFLYVVYVFSEGIVEGLREVFIDDWQLPVNLTANLNAGQVVDVPGPASATNRYGGRVRMIWNPGVYYANPASSTVGQYLKTNIFAESPSFTNQMNFNGLATLAVRYEWKEIKTQADSDTNPFGGGIPKVQICLMGRRIAALDANAINFTYEAAPVRYSTNPAEILLDYLRNPRYGKGLANDDIDWESWVRSANKCNTTVNYVTGQSFAGPILTCNYCVNTSQTIFANVKTLLMGFRAYMPYVQGKYKLRIEDAGNEFDILSGVATVVMTATTKPYLKNQFTGNVCDVVGNITYTGIDKTSKYTSYSVTYVDPDQKWANQEVIYPEGEAERQAYINQDGGRENPGSATFPTLTNYAIAKDMARLLFLKSRRQETLSLTVSSEGLELEPGDNIRVEGNILNFNTGSLIVPWRVVSVKINDNMTVDLGLVKNPDDIYPHARYNEEDTVDPVYVPKGSDIYYPSSENRGDPIGLVPPRSAPFPAVVPPNLPPQVPPPPYVPPAVYVPPAPEIGPAPPVITPSPPASPTPVPVIPPAPFTANLSLKSSKATLITGNTYSYNLVFTQPSDGLYSYSIFYWRLNAYSPWQEIRVTTLPGSGGDIPVSFTCTFGLFDFYVRSYASDGRASNRVVQGQVVFRQNTAEQFGLSGIAGVVSVQTVTDGWAVPASAVATAPRYNDIIYDFAIIPQTSSGLPLVRRKVFVRWTQIQDTLNQTPNDLISGIRVYYKNSAETYYAYEDIIFDNITGYTPYNQTSVNLIGDFGARYGGSEQYDFTVKLLYKNGGNATKYLPPGRGPVESFIGNFTGYIIYGTNSTAAKVNYLDIPANFSILTVDQAPQGPKAGSEIIPSIKAMSSDYTKNILRWEFEKPVSTKFTGFKIRMREIVPGTDPGFTTFEVGAVLNEVTLTIFHTITDGGFRLNTFYDWVVTAQYWDPVTATTLDSDNSLVCRANVPLNAFQIYGNQLVNSVFNWTTQNTKTALNALDAPFAGVPTPGLKTWVKKQLSKEPSAGQPPSFYRDGYYGVYNYSGGAGGGPTDARATINPGTTPVVTNWKLSTYYTLTFTTPNDTFTNIIVYRRVYNADSATRLANTAGIAKYNGLGAWEKITIPRTSITKSGGVYTLNLRGPLSPALFDNKYEINAGTTLYQKIYGPDGNWPQYGSGIVINSVYPYWGVGNGGGTYKNIVEFLFSIEDAGVVSDKAARVTDFDVPFTLGSYTFESDGFISGNVSKLNVVNVSDYNTFVAGYKRNINEALTGINLNQLVLIGGTTVPYSNVSFYNTPSVNWIRLQGPDGVTVY
jgi:hypothetical protein